MTGRIQLISQGVIGEILTDNPTFSFFSKRFTTYTNWAKESYKSEFNDNIYLDDIITFTIPQNCGDILQGVTLSFKSNHSQNNLKKLSSGNPDVIVPVETFGISVIEYTELTLGDQVIDRLTSDDIFIYNEYNISGSHLTSLNALHGESYTADSPFIFRPEFNDGMYSTTGYNYNVTENYRVHIPFNILSGIPLCAIYKQELKITIKLRRTKEVFFIANSSNTRWNPEEQNKITGKHELNNVTLHLDVIHLDVYERYYLRSNLHTLLFEQHQHNHFLIDSKSDNGTFNLEFKNNVKEIFFIVKRLYRDYTQDDLDVVKYIYTIEFFNIIQGLIGDPKYDIYDIFFAVIYYLDRIQKVKMAVPLMYMSQEYVTLTCDKDIILDDTTGDNAFLSSCITNLYHKSSPVRSNIGSYSFAIYPEKKEPSGHLNFSSIKHAELKIKLVYNGSQGTYDTNYNFMDEFGVPSIDTEKQVIVSAKSYNILKINNGIGEIIY